MTTWGETTTIYSTVVDETTIDETTFEGLLEKRTLGTPIQVSKPTVGSSLILINDHKEISFDRFSQIEHSVFKARKIYFPG